ncbi:venom protease-like [Macrosteles quadrilineatus]|uniref:venom protease-like n=1 Tax=Macrosteles quadrilineatus TaxID=74068 RepID=UPI0023E28C73|nr:venom protease-like [Macrosteles quadrilineatus]
MAAHWLLLICLVKSIHCLNDDISEATDMLLMEGEISRIVSPDDKHQSAAYSESGVGQDQTCATGAKCTSLQSCRLVRTLMNKNCLASNKLRELTCGYLGDEPLVCCPVSAIKHDPEPVNGEACGAPLLYNWWKNNYQGVGALPFVARIGFRSKTQGTTSYPCCGSIISKRVILTSAHCALAQTAKQYVWTVRVGEYDMAKDPDCGKSFCAHPVQDILISHVVVHPGYEPKSFRHNIALLVLRHNINFSVNAQPVCLRNSPYSLVGQRAKLVGWGKTPGQLETPDEQQTVEMPILQRKKCTDVYDDVIPVTQDHLCVGGEKNKDACSGFGGAPLVYLDRTDQPKYYQVGIVSFGSDKCGVQGIPSVYSSIDKYLDWIKLNSPDL